MNVNSFRDASVEVQLHGRMDGWTVWNADQHVRGSLPQRCHLHPISIRSDFVRLSARLRRWPVRELPISQLPQRRLLPLRRGQGHQEKQREGEQQQGQQRCRPEVCLFLSARVLWWALRAFTMRLLLPPGIAQYPAAFHHPHNPIEINWNPIEIQLKSNWTCS